MRQVPFTEEMRAGGFPLPASRDKSGFTPCTRIGSPRFDLSCAVCLAKSFAHMRDRSRYFAPSLLAARRASSPGRPLPSHCRARGARATNRGGHFRQVHRQRRLHSPGVLGVLHELQDMRRGRDRTKMTFLETERRITSSAAKIWRRTASRSIGDGGSAVQRHVAR